MTEWRFGCDKEIRVFIPRGYGHREVKVRCGSTAYDGGVNQCEACARTKPQPRVPEYGDIEHMDEEDYRHE